MKRFSFRWLLAIGPFVAGASLFAAAEQSQSNFADYRTVATAQTTKVSKTGSDGSGVSGFLGIAVIRDTQGRLVVEDVQTDSPGAKAGVKKDDVVTKIGDRAVATPLAFREWVQSYGPGETLKIHVTRGSESLELTSTLTATSRPKSKGDAGFGKGGKGGPLAGGKGPGAFALWQKPVIRLAVICFEFTDIKHNAKVSTKDWEEAFFSKGVYKNKKSPTDQTVFGSLNDYFLEQSAGKFHIEGKVFDWVNMGKKRSDYIKGSGTSEKTVPLNEAVAKVVARDGKDCFAGFDDFVFVYAGERHQTNAGAVYYPHVGGVQHDGNRWNYLLTFEGASKMTAVGGFAKLVGQVLGLPDLAARKEDSGSRGLGAWCALSNPQTDGKPQHFGPWAKERLGWIQPAVIDPTVKQKLLLSPIEDSPRECFKVLVRPNGSEYLLLENRRKKGFDADLPGEGLLVWRVVNGRPQLVVSHGVEGPSGPLTHLSSVPYPSDANNSFTPETTPSSRSPQGGGLPVHISEIQRLPDGRIAFKIGYEYR